MNLSSLWFWVLVPLPTPNLKTFSPTSMQMTSLFSVPTPTLLRRLKPLPSMHQILRSRRMNKVYLCISAPKSTITLFTPQFVQSNTHPQVTLNNSILPLERTPCILGVTFDPHFKFNAHVKSLVTRALPRINILKALTGTNWGQQMETILITYQVFYQVPFHVCSSHLVPKTSSSLVQKL